MRFLLGSAPTTEIVKAERLGSVILFEGTVPCHPINTPMVLLIDQSVDVAPAATAIGSSQDIEMGLSPLP